MTQDPKAQPTIETVNGTATYVGTETEDSNGRWNDSYSVSQGYYVVHRGIHHDVYTTGRQPNFTQSKLKLAALSGYRGTFIHAERVGYGKKGTPQEMREYRSGSSPVGTKHDWLLLAKKHGYDGIVLTDSVENEKYVASFITRSFVKMNHDTKDVEEGSLKAEYLRTEAEEVRRTGRY